MKSMVISGKTIPVKMTVTAMEAMEEEYGSMEDMFNALQSAKIKDIMNLLYTLHVAACDFTGETPVTRKWLSAHLPPKQLQEAAELVADVVNHGMEAESMEEADDEPVDMVLAEIEKKTADR